MKQALLATILILASSLAAASGGGWNGGGDRRAWAREVAWFLTRNDAAITYCLKYRSEAEFGVSGSEMRELVERSFGRWVDYIKSKHIKTALQNGADFARKLVAAPECTGKEDLRIELDTTSAEIETEKKKYRDPVAFSAKGDLRKGSEQTGAWFENSLIWISDLKPRATDKSKALLKKKLEVILTHEFGHVFGNGHVENTVMAEDAAEAIADIEKDDDYRSAPVSSRLALVAELAKIDQRSVLLLSPRENSFDVVFYTGMTETNELDNGPRNSPSAIASANRMIVNELLGIQHTLGDYHPATRGVTTLTSSIRDGYKLVTQFNGRAAKEVVLGKPTQISHSREKRPVFQRLVSIERREIQSFEHEAMSLEFQRPIAGGGKLPVTLHLNRSGAMTLEVGDPAKVNRSWLILLSWDPKLSR